MKILFVAATEPEFKGIKAWVKQYENLLQHEYTFLKTGIGIAKATFASTQTMLQHKFDFVIQVGIAGSFHKSLNIGDVVWIKQDMFSDLGADTQDGFLTLFQLGLENTRMELSFSKIDFLDTSILNDLSGVTGITSDTIHNREARIEEIISKYQPDVETMEGAAIMYVCEQLNIPNIHIRSISNLVAPREKNEWNIESALTSLTNWEIEFIKHLEKRSL